MKANITSVSYVKEYDTKFGKLHLHKIEYSDKTAFYSSKKKDQSFFIKDKECEFTEEKKNGQNGEYITIKPVRENKGFSGYSKAIKKEQSKYSGFAVSYVKDLIIADKIDVKDWEKASEKIFNFMVNLDKSIES